jgi:dephospho-CoA kinase
MNKILLLVGAPASGKNTAGRFIISRLRDEGKEVVHLNEDNYIETVVRLYDPEMKHVYIDNEGTIIFKDEFTLEKMSEFLFTFAVHIYPNKYYVIESARGWKEKSIASNFSKMFECIPQSVYKKLQVIHIVANKDTRHVRDENRRRNGDQYCPNIEEYAQNDLEEVKKKYTMIDFVTVHNNGNIDDYQKQLSNILDSYQGN